MAWGLETRLAVAFGAAKGALVSIVLASLDVTFWKQVIIAAVSGALTFTGVIVAALIAAHATRESRREISDIKRAVGANKRTDDTP